MKVSGTQMKAFEKSAEERYDRRLTDYLRKSFEDAAALPPEELRAGVRRQVVAAEGYGLVTEQEIATFVVAAWLLGEDFDTAYPEMKTTLSSRETPSAEKATFVRRRTEELAQEADRRGRK